MLAEDADEPAERRTYGELAGHVWATAAALQAAGVVPGARVLLVLPTGWAFIETLLAFAKLREEFFRNAVDQILIVPSPPIIFFDSTFVL